MYRKKDVCKEITNVVVELQGYVSLQEALRDDDVYLPFVFDTLEKYHKSQGLDFFFIKEGLTKSVPFTVSLHNCTCPMSYHKFIVSQESATWSIQSVGLRFCWVWDLRVECTSARKQNKTNFL